MKQSPCNKLISYYITQKGLRGELKPQKKIQIDNITSMKSPELGEATRTPVIQKTKRSSESTYSFGYGLPSIITRRPIYKQNGKMASKNSIEEDHFTSKMSPDLGKATRTPDMKKTANIWDSKFYHYRKSVG